MLLVRVKSANSLSEDTAVKYEFDKDSATLSVDRFMGTAKQ